MVMDSWGDFRLHKRGCIQLRLPVGRTWHMFSGMQRYESPHAHCIKVEFRSGGKWKTTWSSGLLAVATERRCSPVLERYVTYLGKPITFSGCWVHPPQAEETLQSVTWCTIRILPDASTHPINHSTIIFDKINQWYTKVQWSFFTPDNCTGNSTASTSVNNDRGRKERRLGYVMSNTCACLAFSCKIGCYK